MRRSVAYLTVEVAFLRQKLAKSNLGKALSYALNQRESLERVLDGGEVELDNNLVENAIRPTAIGKKNWLFMGSKESGHCSTVR